MKTNRIYFKNNPWPEGHGIKHFEWNAEIKNGDIWFHFHLETAYYYAERDIEESEDEDEDDYESWQSPAVWGNYHACTISSTQWHSGGFKVCSLKEYSENFLDGLELEIDNTPDLVNEDYEKRAFHIYLLGHDAVANHKIKFTRRDQTYFDIEWSGKIALVYAGDYHLKHDFVAYINKVSVPKIIV